MLLRRAENYPYRATGSRGKPGTGRGPIGDPTVTNCLAYQKVTQQRRSSQSVFQRETPARPAWGTDPRELAMGGEKQPGPIRQYYNILSADPSEGFKIQTTSQFPGRIKVLPGPEALAAAQSLSSGLVWSDGLRLENGRCGAGIAWPESIRAWKTRGSH